MQRLSPKRAFEHPSQSGMTLIETVVALAILLIVASGIMTVGFLATTTTENQGHLAARTAEYAQDKMEQLISLNYGDNQTDTTVFPSGATGGTGLCSDPLAPPPCGSTDPNNPVTGYVDYLDSTGQPLPLGVGGAAPAGWYYIRVWQISQFAPNIKQITVTSQVAFNVGGSTSGGIGGAQAQATLTSLKTYPY